MRRSLLLAVGLTAALPFIACADGMPEEPSAPSAPAPTSPTAPPPSTPGSWPVPDAQPVAYAVLIVSRDKVYLNNGRVRTNFVLFRVERDREAFLGALERRGVLMLAFMPHNGQIRAVTHYGIDRSDVEATVKAVREALDELPPTVGGATSSTRAYAGAVA